MTKKIKIQFSRINALAILTILASCTASVATAKQEPIPIIKDVCALPTSPASTQEETAWQLFVAINCKTGAGELTWETWTTQACLNNPDDCKDGGRLRASALRNALNTGDNPRRTGGCSAMTTASTADPSLRPFVPANLSANPVFCEEVTINPSEEDYARSKGLLTQAGQVNYLQAGNTIDFPTDAVEVKADWVPASSYTGVTFDCSKPNSKVYMEMIDGTCYALAGIHISSKLYPNWLWATFEPQYSVTNPNRCNPDLYNSCTDSWGSNPATSTGSDTAATKQLTTLFNTAGSALDPSFRNYRLTGTQTVFSQPTTSQGMLGSSFVEFNADVPAQQASCITCHNYAQRQPTPAPSGSTPPGGPLPGGTNVGTPTPLPPAYKPLDFSWFLGFGVPAASSCQDIDAGPIWSNTDANGKCPSVCTDVARTWNGQWKTTQTGVMSVCGCCL